MTKVGLIVSTIVLAASFVTHPALAAATRATPAFAPASLAPKQPQLDCTCKPDGPAAKNRLCPVVSVTGAQVKTVWSCTVAGTEKAVLVRTSRGAFEKKLPVGGEIGHVKEVSLSKDGKLVTFSGTNGKTFNVDPSLLGE